MMMKLLPILLLVHSVHTFVYSCDQVVFQLINSDFEQCSKYAYVITQEDFSNWGQLEHIYLHVGQDKYSFAAIAKNDDGFRVVNNNGKLPWKLSADDVEFDCDDEFTLILKSDETELVLPERTMNYNYYMSGSAVFVVPQVGMWFNKHSMTGDGNISVYTGAGSGEEEERYLLQYWPCESMPDWIWSFENVITIEADATCSFTIQHSSDLSFAVTIFRHDRLAVLVSGRSDNLQNLRGIQHKMRIGIGHQEVSNVTLNMQIALDSANSGSVGIVQHEGEELFPFRNGSFNEMFETEYFEVQWNPSPLKAIEIGTNQDNVYLDIQVSSWEEASECPEGYSLVKSANNEAWCYNMVFRYGEFNFTDSVKTCEKSGDTLPIVTSDEINRSLAAFTAMHMGFDDIWLGLICDMKTNRLMWQDGQALDYDAFIDGNLFACTSDSDRITSTYYDGDWIPDSQDRPLTYCVCARRPMSYSTSLSPSISSAKTTSSKRVPPVSTTKSPTTTTQTTTQSAIESSCLLAGAIVLIAIREQVE